MDTKGRINPPSHNKSYIHVIIDAFSHFVVTVPIKSNIAKTAIKTLLHHWIIKFGPPIYLVTIAVPNMLIRKWHTFVHSWELDTPLEQLTLLGQKASLKYKIDILVLTYECFYITLQKIGHSKSICKHMHTINNLSQNSTFLLMKLFFIHGLGYPSP